jgi:hypothetical protein
MHRFNAKELSDSYFRVTRHINYKSKYGIQQFLPSVNHKNVQLAGSSDLVIDYTEFIHTSI